MLQGLDPLLRVEGERLDDLLDRPATSPHPLEDDTEPRVRVQVVGAGSQQHAPAIGRRVLLGFVRFAAHRRYWISLMRSS